MTEQLTGYEASSVVEVGAVLDDSPADAQEVYLRTMGYSERSIAAVAAKRAGSGSGGSMPWAAFDSLVGAEIADGNAGVLGWETSFIGPGTLSSCTVGTSFGDPAILLPEVGCYLVTLNTYAPNFAFGDLSGTVTLTNEIQVFNNESDPWMTLHKRPNGDMARGVLTAVINTLASDNPSTGRGFSVTAIPEGTAFTPPAGNFSLKVVQLATT